VPLNPYIAHAAGGQEECAVLVFAPTARVAKRVAFPVLQDFVMADYVDVRVRRLRQYSAWWRSLQRDDTRPHVVDNPPSCRHCEQWGHPIADGLCNQCACDIDDERLRAQLRTLLGASTVAITYTGSAEQDAFLDAVSRGVTGGPFLLGD
jgi:uncharacterized paraquat-inducible protein A